MDAKLIFCGSFDKENRLAAVKFPETLFFQNQTPLLLLLPKNLKT
jgi:hypothetical protein